MIKKIIFGLLAIPGILLIIFVAVANRLTAGFDNGKEIDLIVDYMVKMDGVSSLTGLDFEIGMLLVLHKTNEYSHLLITLGIIWTTIFVFLIVNNGRFKVEKKN